MNKDEVIKQLVEDIEKVKARIDAGDLDEWSLQSLSAKLAAAIAAARELLRKQGEPLTVADKINMVADVMEACGVIYIENIENMPSDYDIHFGFDIVNVTVNDLVNGLQSSDLRRAAEEI